MEGRDEVGERIGKEREDKSRIIFFKWDRVGEKRMDDVYLQFNFSFLICRSRREKYECEP